eukprot:9812872-Heterocapsa_arctica.AAC.1
MQLGCAVRVLVCSDEEQVEAERLRAERLVWYMQKHNAAVAAEAKAKAAAVLNDRTPLVHP